MLLCRNIFFFDTPVVDSDVGMLAGMSEYYGSEGFDRPPSDVYSSFGGFVFVSSTRAATSRVATRMAIMTER